MDSEDQILNCEFTFRCPQAWDALEITENSQVRHCATCNRSVTFITTVEEIAIAVQYGACVAANVNSEEFKGPHVGVGRVGDPEAEEQSSYDFYLEQGTPLTVECLRAIQQLLETDENLMQLRRRLTQTECLLRAALSQLEAHFFMDRAKSLGVPCRQQPAD
jgi:hypothetical protein